MTERKDKPQSQSVIAGKVLACFCMAGFLVVLALVVTKHAVAFDDAIRNFFYALRSDQLTSVLKVLTNTADKYFIIAVCLILLAVPRTRLYFGVPLSAGALGTILLNSLLKHLVQRQRPDLMLRLVEENGYSFPSGHSITSMFFYGMALWLVWHYLHRYGAGADVDGGVDRGVGSPDLSGITNRVPGSTSAPDVLPPPATKAAGDSTLPRWKIPPYYSKKTAIILTVLLLIPMLIVGLSRIYLGVHFPTDVLGGWLLGAFAICIEAEIILALELRNKR